MSKATLLEVIEEIQNHTFNFETPTTDTNGSVSGYFARYDRIPDSYGDVCQRGFLNDSVKRRQLGGHPFPLCYNHDLNQIIGVVTRIEDRPFGAYMTAQFFDSEKAQEIREILKKKCVYQMSFAYKIQDSCIITLPDGKKANELRKCDLYEITITPTPAQPLSVITEIKGGRVLSRKSDLLRYIESIRP